MPYGKGTYGSKRGRPSKAVKAKAAKTKQQKWERRNSMARRGLYANINARKKAGTSRSKSKSTISAKAYSNMKKGFPKKKK